MKKLIFSAIALIAFSSISMANTIEIEDPKIDLSLINTAKLNQHNADAIGIGVTAVRDNITIKIIDGIEVFHLRGKSSGTKKSSRTKRVGK